jgi:hypothetical protein
LDSIHYRPQEVLVHPTIKSMLALIVAGAVLFVLSASGQTNGFWQSGLPGSSGHARDASA